MIGTARRSALRPRLLGALLLTSVVTLGVAALALLSPLEQRLHADSETRAPCAAISNSKAGVRTSATSTVSPVCQKPTNCSDRQPAADAARRAGHDPHTASRTGQPGFARDLDLPDYYAQARESARHERRVHPIVGEQLVVRRARPHRRPSASC